MIYTFAKSHDPIVLREKPRVTRKGLLENKHERTSGCYIWPSTGTCRFSSLCVAFYIVLHCAVLGSVCTDLGLITLSDRYCPFTSPSLLDGCCLSRSPQALFYKTVSQFLELHLPPQCVLCACLQKQLVTFFLEMYLMGW